MRVDIKGEIIPNELKDVYDYFGIQSTCPAQIDASFAELEAGDSLEVKINSTGGDVFAGQEIYSKLRDRSLKRGDVRIEIESIAASAASIIAMAAPCSISPVGMIMIHNASTSTDGNHAELEKTAERLHRIDEALASAYVTKTGKSKDEILQFMELETWLDADRAVGLGFVDQISGMNAGRMTASLNSLSVTPEMIEEYHAAQKQKDSLESRKHELLKDIDQFGSTI